MRFISRAIIGTTAATLTLSLAACGSSSSAGVANQPADGASVAAATDISQCTAEGTTIDVAFNSLAKEPMEAAVKVIEDRYPGLSINAVPSVSTDYGELTQQIVADIAVGKRPDVIMTGLGQMQFWVDTYNPVPLDKGVLPETYQTQFLGAGTARDGVTYLAPAQISAPVMAVNQDLLDAAGAGDAEDIKTYEDLLDVARQVSDHTGKPSVSIAPSGLPEWYTQGLVQNSGGTLVNEDGTAAFGDAAGIAALDIWSELGRDGLEAGIPAASEAVDIFTSGTLPVTMITTSNIASISQGVGDKFDWMPIKLPSIDGVQDRALPAGGNGYMVLSDDSCRAAFSGELIGQILTPESVMQASGTQRSYIPVDTIARDELLASDQASPQMTFAWTFDNKLTQWGGGFPGAHTAKIYDAIELMDQQLQTGAETATAVQDAVATIDAIVLGENS
ncbi:ABC transporter substrate-binding protein [Arthrobacter sulfonylureivorans]|uniref:Extracellular solute-binding protein n=1 Tax=Arthrobacter sulfonylureivorans TaxID=2486855 RepID=A0ABY3WCR1_9MICC|nr:extracellular solute-binding protein [Arthrobacter sulfonylureivorans]UNK46171.1 extracellular solute-binding protein [Arthrobacter sulfonylureivorans]